MNIKSLSFANLKTQYESYTNKKRIISIAVTLFIILLLWFIVLMSPLLSKSEKVNRNIFTNLNKQIKALQTNILTLSKANHIPTNIKKEPEINFYNQLLNQANNKNLPDSIDDVVNMILKNKNGLKLISFKTHLIPLNVKDSSKIPFNLQQIDISFEGSFMHLATFLKRFQNPSYPLYFNKLKLRVNKYPNGKIHLLMTTIIAKAKRDKS